MEAGLPVVTTSVGEEGIGGTPDVHYLVADTDDRLAEATIGLLLEPAKGVTIGASGRRFIKQHHDFPGRLAEIEALLEESVGHVVV
jgi:hypothetical protein